MKILLADNDAESRSQITRVLTADGHTVIVADDGCRASDILCRNDRPDMAILDATLADMTTAEICRAVGEQLDEPHPYILVLAPPDNDEVFGCSADDILVRPFDPRLLNARIRLAGRVVTLQKRCAPASDTEASLDSLTGTWNRSASMEFLHAHFARSTRDGVSLAAILGDMDNFQSLNVSHGTGICDSVLRESAKRIKAALRPYDCLGRYGGEEFLVIAPDCTIANAHAIAERLRGMIADEPFSVEGKKVQCTISFGVATTADTGALDEDGLLRSADTALYAAKENGRNRVELARRIPRQRLPQPRFLPPPKSKELVQ